MSTALKSFDGSPLKAFIESPMKARNPGSEPGRIGLWFVFAQINFCQLSQPVIVGGTQFWGLDPNPPNAPIHKCKRFRTYEISDVYDEPNHPTRHFLYKLSVNKYDCNELDLITNTWDGQPGDATQLSGISLAQTLAGFPGNVIGNIGRLFVDSIDVDSPSAVSLHYHDTDFPRHGVFTVTMSDEFTESDAAALLAQLLNSQNLADAPWPVIPDPLPTCPYFDGTNPNSICPTWYGGIIVGFRADGTIYKQNAGSEFIDFPNQQYLRFPPGTLGTYHRPTGAGQPPFLGPGSLPDDTYILDPNGLTPINGKNYTYDGHFFDYGYLAAATALGQTGAINSPKNAVKMRIRSYDKNWHEGIPLQIMHFKRDFSNNPNTISAGCDATPWLSPLTCFTTNITAPTNPGDPWVQDCLPDATDAADPNKLGGMKPVAFKLQFNHGCIGQ